MDNPRSPMVQSASHHATDSLQSPTVSALSMMKRRWRKLASALAPMYLHLGAAALVLGLSAAAWFVGIGPVLEARARAGSEQQRLNRDRSQLEHFETQTIQLERELDQLRQKLAASPMQLAPTSAINTQLAQVSDLAADMDLTVRELDPGQAQHWPQYDVVPISLGGRGQLPDLARFLRRVTRELPDFGVAALALEAQSKAGEPIVRFDLTLAWYAAPGKGE